MDAQYISIYKVHEHLLDKPPSVENLQDRITAQKLIYLADAAGVNCGDYSWNWYLRGPYSPSLTKVLYDNQLNDINMKNYKLRDDVANVLDNLKGVMNNNLGLSQSDWLELLASLHYLYHKHSLKDFGPLCQKLLEYKPKYRTKHVKCAFKVLEELRFVS